MAREFRTQHREVAKVLERQMRNWEIAREQQAKTEPPASKPVHDFITISRAVGLQGEELVAGLEDRLRWPVFDREILQAMAGDDACRQRLYAAMDERDMSWLEEITFSLMRGEFSRNDYFHRLTQTVLSLARKGHAIFLGRATDLILPRDVGMRIRLTATRDYCIRLFADAHNLTLSEAARQVEEIEHERARFIRNHFHVEAGEQTRYDLICNMERFRVDQVLELVLTALKIRGIGA